MAAFGLDSLNTDPFDDEADEPTALAPQPRILCAAVAGFVGSGVA